MHYDEAEYPYSYRDLPVLPELLDELEWDVVCLFDACRWDAFEKMCAESEPVHSTVWHTHEWMSDVVANDEYDWSDVTYISGNLMTSTVTDTEEFDGAVEDHVRRYEQLYQGGNDALDDVLGTTRPSEITRKLMLSPWETPIVIHFFQPHNPFIGNVHLNASTSPRRTEMPLGDPDKMSGEAQLVKEGHVSLEMYRAAYLENLKLVWEAKEDIRQKFGKVITTADHGEILGPEEFGHGHRNNQGGVVPFHTNWDVELPSPESVGAAESHEWTTATATNDKHSESESRNSESPTVDQEVEEKLRALGYQPH